MLMDSFDILGTHIFYGQNLAWIFWLFPLSLKLCVLFSEDGVSEGFPFLPNGVLNCNMKVPWKHVLNQ